MGKLVSVRNITEQKLIEAKLQQIAITDALTGLANHRHFYELLEQNRKGLYAKSPISHWSMFDIDLFKQINDTHGHLVGDQVLREIAMHRKAALRPYDILCRYGGEEFTLILPDTKPGEAVQIAERLREDHSKKRLSHRRELTSK